MEWISNTITLQPLILESSIGESWWIDIIYWWDEDKHKEE
jgi:hypothetical protein